jgi:transcriptional regulator with XRE-family HTH domain
MGKGPTKEATAAQTPKRNFHKQPRPSKFERVSSERFADAEKRLQQLFGRNLREARLRAGLTQTDVANIIDTTQSYVGGIERGEVNVQLSTVLRLAYAVRVDPGALLLGDRAAHYSLETLVRLVGALYAHLQETVGEQAKNLPQGELLTLIAGSPFQFGVTETPLRADDPSDTAGKRE